MEIAAKKTTKQNRWPKNHDILCSNAFSGIISWAPGILPLSEYPTVYIFSPANLL